MDGNELGMKSRGSEKVWKTIKSKSGALKEVSNTQIGQQIIMDECIRILTDVQNWIKTGSSKVDRIPLNEFFTDEEILLEKLAQTFLLLAGSIYLVPPNKRWRHKEVLSLCEKVLPELPFELAWRFLEVVVDFSEYFSLDKSLVTERNQYKWRIKYVCNLSEVILSKIATDAAAAFFPLPMTEPPLDWSFENGEIKGGYKSHQFEMVVTSSKNVDYSKHSEHIYDAINYIQGIPWRINKPVLEQIKKDIKPPEGDDYMFTPFPPMDKCEFEIDLKDENLEISDVKKESLMKHRNEFKNLIETYNAEKREFESAVGKYRNSKMAMEIADQYQDELIYFPHFYDFRGRVYPLAVGLSPQGSDIVKSMLEYDRGGILNEEGAEWCWAYLASLYGDDKIPFNERIERGKELLYTDYLEADEPYQFLAHQLEMQKYVEDTDRVMKIRIHLDACNSGSQFTSAITGDKAGCMATNVIPTINPDGTHERKDAYLLVAHKAQELTEKTLKLEDDPEVIERLKFIKTLLIEHGRKICKRPVMVSNYGGTDGGRIEIIADVLRELKCDRDLANKKTSALLSKIIGNSIVGVLNGGKAFEIYIQKMNGLIAKTNRAVEWKTSDGFHVVHFKNKELKTKTASCLLPGSRKRITIIRKIYSKKANVSKMRSAISPNYIHSLDAELLRRTALRMKEVGIENSDWIHDSFGCHPNHVNVMLQITKEEFLALIERKPLDILDGELKDQIQPTKTNLKLLKTIPFPDLKGFNIEVDGLQGLMKSVWFFS